MALDRAPSTSDTRAFRDAVHPLGPAFLRVREEDAFTFEGTALRTVLPRPTAKEVGNSSSYGRDASPVSTTSKNTGQHWKPRVPVSYTHLTLPTKA